MRLFYLDIEESVDCFVSDCIFLRILSRIVGRSFYVIDLVIFLGFLLRPFIFIFVYSITNTRIISFSLIAMDGGKKNSWLAHVKKTMKQHRDKSFKQVLKLAKKSYRKSYKKSQSQSQSGGKKYAKKSLKKQRGGAEGDEVGPGDGPAASSVPPSTNDGQKGGSGVGGHGGKAVFGANAAPVA